MERGKVGVRLLLCLGGFAMAVLGCSGDDGPAGVQRVVPPTNDAAWPMHAVDSRFRGANALGPGDVDQDGFTDYVTNYEFDQRLVVSFHPGATGDVRAPWPTVVAWMPEPLTRETGVNPEHAALGDFDGDGNLDVVVAQGWSSLPVWEGSEPGIRLVWGPSPDRVLDGDAWTDAGRIPATVDRGHMIHVTPLDVNGDGATDIVSGGRVHGGNGRKGGVIWIEAPAAREERRDLTRWTVHDIDPEQFSGHGLVLTDVDRDGDPDLALANADFDTPEEEERVLWYENPGIGTEAQKAPWPIHVIYQGSEFSGKPQIAVADLDRDGREDMLVGVAEAIYYFRKTGLRPVTWERVVIAKDPVARWPTRPVRVADVNGDGKLEIIGMLMHEEGDLPGNLAAAFWMEYAGREPRADNWTTHVIKWGAGGTMLLPIFGEKWDQVDVTDVDRDGDLDLVANCEEWWEADLEFRAFWDPRVNARSVALVWFENRLREAPYAFAEKGGLCVMEAEHPTDLEDGTWIERSQRAGYEGSGYMQDHVSLDPAGRLWNQTLGLSYAVEVQGGTYLAWVRRWVPEGWGLFLGGDESNSALLGVDGEPLVEVFDNEPGGAGEWTWIRCPEPVDLAPGTHVVQLRVREGGYAADRLLLTADASFTPTGAGPEETLRTAP